jgi:hypothetical protein
LGEESEVVVFGKLKEGQEMRTNTAAGADQGCLAELARGWGKIFAHEGFGADGPDLTVDFQQIEDLAGEGARALVQGVVREAVWQQALALGDTQPCPTCAVEGRVEWKERTVQTRYGDVAFPEPACHCTRCRRAFFPSKAGAEARRPRL